MTVPENALNQHAKPAFSTLGMYALCSMAMCYGWGWRGSYGHEAGAMLPGALLGMCICLASGRVDLYRRCAIAGLFGAVAWAWGGALTNMEHKSYISSDSFPDILYGFSCIFLIGLLWSGMGGGMLALAFTRPRSELNGYCRVLAANGTVFLAIYLLFVWKPEIRQAIDRYVELHYHDGEAFSATIVLIVSFLYWVFTSRDRQQAGLFTMGAAAWWIGYGLLVKLGGLYLAPPYRSESWGGFVGVLILLLVFHHRRGDRAAKMITLYAMLTGGLAFDIALLIRHPFAFQVGPFAKLGKVGSWIWAEYAFGFFMGMGVAYAAVRLLRVGLRPPEEDCDRAPSDQFAAFVILIAIPAMNLRGNVDEWNRRYDLFLDTPVAGLHSATWFYLVGLLLLGAAVYALWMLRRGTLPCIPRTTFEKGFLLAMLCLAINQAGRAMHRFPEWNTTQQIAGDISMWLFAIATGWMLLMRSNDRFTATAGPADGPTTADPTWRVGWRYWLVWAMVPVYLLLLTISADWMNDGTTNRGRLRFGKNAYWRLELQRQQEQQQQPPAEPPKKEKNSTK